MWSDIECDVIFWQHLRDPSIFFVVHGGVLFTHFSLNLVLNLINRWFRYLILGGLWCCLIPYNYQCFRNCSSFSVVQAETATTAECIKVITRQNLYFFVSNFKNWFGLDRRKKPKSVQCVEDLITSFTILITLFTVKSEVWIRMVLFVRKRRRMQIWRGSSAPTSATNTPRDVVHKHVILQGTQLSKGTAGNTCHANRQRHQQRVGPVGPSSCPCGYHYFFFFDGVTFRCFPDRVFCYRLGRHRRSAWWSRRVKPTFLQAGVGCLPNVF